MSFLSKIFPFLQNRAEKFENWTVKVGMNNPAAQGNISILKQSNLSEENYNARVKDFSEDYIEIIDKDNDGKISYDEFVKYNIDEANDNLGNLTEQDIAHYQAQLKTIYERLNVDDENASKGQLDYREVMNYFYTMDSNNGDSAAHGNISQYEYIATSEALADNGKQGKEISEKLNSNFDKQFRNL